MHVTIKLPMRIQGIVLVSYINLLAEHKPTDARIFGVRAEISPLAFHF